MINFAELQLRVNEKYSFVGIENKDSQLIFHLPKGFSPEDIRSLDTFDFKRDFFFKLYRVMTVFKQTCLKKEEFDKKIKAGDRDGVVREEEGTEITATHHIESIFYSKIDALQSILDAYDELKILTLVQRLGRSETLDYSQLHRFLHKGIFLENNATYIDSMNLPRKEIHFEATDIVAMYCYILTEIKDQLKEEVRYEVQVLAEKFKQKYIGAESNLFGEKSYQQVMNDLKDALNLIDHYTPIKDPDYWDFYEAIEAFLFGDLHKSGEGEIWGFNNFHSVWESMCLTYLVKTTNADDLLYLDETFISEQILNDFHSCERSLDFSNVFNINSTEVFPDAVTIRFLKLSKNSISPYTLTKNNWNDYGYLTTIECSPPKRIIKIAYIHQQPQKHTLDLPKKLLPSNENESLILPFPDTFYSFWNPSEKFSIEELEMMRLFNHIFYLSLRKKIFSFNDFAHYLVVEIMKNDSSYERFMNPEYSYLIKNIFSASLFRDFSENGYLNYAVIRRIYKEFESFLQRYNKELQIQVIDIKYSNFEYYLESENMEEIKSRSIRKQFVYEYLIQKHLERSKNKFKDCPIKSEFWMPVYSKNTNILKKGPEYLNGYIELKGVNIMAIIDNYLETEST